MGPRLQDIKYFNNLYLRCIFKVSSPTLSESVLNGCDVANRPMGRVVQSLTAGIRLRRLFKAFFKGMRKIVSFHCFYVA